MTFDLSRIRFDARKDFLGVVMQQGRVQLDADWNEWGAQLARRLQAGTLDTFNGSVVPRITHEGFLIEASGGALSIGSGRIYVDGLLAENHGGSPEAWDPQLGELTGTTAIDYAKQPYCRRYPSDKFDSTALPEGGPHLVYVDVWQRDVSAVQEPDLIEVAVGVDTTGRRQTVWQVKVLADVGPITRDTADEDIPGWREATEPSAARLSTAVGTPPADDENPCLVAPTAGYRGLENQLYRVEVHTGGPLGTATFKWSRDNATVASRVTHINPERKRITVESIGRDDVLRFNDGDWVEVTDDWRELNNLPGELCRILVDNGVDETARTLTFDRPLPATPAGIADPSDFPVGENNATLPARNTRVRRWDHSGQVRRLGGDDGSAVHQDLNDPASSGEIVIPPSATRLFLEQGIVVQFDLLADPDLHPSGGEFKSGDYWVFSARSADASVEPLDMAAPLGIHHHYARLALVNFPDDETDFRTLWPPVLDGDDCSCSMCVSVEGHNNGTATIQQAIDRIKDSGGTICLGIGTYNINQPLNLIGARSLRILGQGWGTLLVAIEPGGIFDIADSTGVTLEGFTAIASAGRSGTTSVIAARNVVDLCAEQINVLGLTVERSTSIGIGLSGMSFGVSVSNCAIVAERGIANVSSEKRNLVVTGELNIEQNLFFCSQRAASFDAASLHFGNTRIDANMIFSGSEAAIVVTGAVLERSQMIISDNTISTTGDGIRAGVDCLTIENNKISGGGKQSGNGIALQEGFDPVAIDQARIIGNRLSALSGNGIVINHRVENVIISENMIDGMGLGALVMSESGAASLLTFSGNQCRNLGQAVSSDNTAFAAIQLIRVERCDVLDNVIAGVALQAITSPGVDALRTAVVRQLRVAGNRFYAIGPDRISSDATVNTAHFLPPFDRLAFDDNSVERIGYDDNSVERIGYDDQQLTGINWRAINIASGRADVRYSADASYLATKEAVYLLTATSATVVPLFRPSATSATVVPLFHPSASIRGNHLRGHQTHVSLILCTQVESCLFAENYCKVFVEEGNEPLVGDLSAGVLNASNNQLIGLGDLQTLHIKPLVKRAIVMGNTSTGPIVVENGASVPDDINLTNIIGL